MTKETIHYPGGGVAIIDYEYVVWDKIDECIHRGPMTQSEAVTWVEEVREMFPVGADIDKLWGVYRRPVGDWEPYEYTRAGLT